MNRTRLWTTLVIQTKASPYKTGLLGVLAVVFLVLVGRRVLGGPRTAEAAPPLISVAAVAAPVLKTTPVSERPQRPRLPDLPDAPVRDLFKADWLTDGRASRLDTVAREYEGEGLSEASPVLLLELTLTERAGDGQRCAVINGRIVQVGSEIGGLVVESITPGLVILTGSGTGRTVLRMN